MSTPPKRVLSGIQPSGALHLGNYFGAMRQQIALQDEFPGECFYFVADYHALTTQRDAQALRQNIHDVAVSYLSFGLDPERAVLFRQSDVPEVFELTWFLQCVTGMGLLERATSYKDKIANGIKPNVGLFNYPTLMAADILIYQSSLVPVGKDQIQHVEFAQDMATYFNQAWCKDSPILSRPEYRLSKTPYVPGVDGKKMSKSYNNTIPLFARGKKLKSVTGKIVTDSTNLGDPLNYAACNVARLLELFLDQTALEPIKAWYASGQRDGAPFGYGHAKQLLAQTIQEAFAKADEKKAYYDAHPEAVQEVLEAGAKRARKIAQETLQKTRIACGIQS